jgi:hypothetical protein
VTCSVVCVLRQGGEYVPEHVRKLHEAVKRWWPAGQSLRFVALTDTRITTKGIEERRLFHPWKGWWAKMELFDAGQDDLGDILYFDLDTMIVGDLWHVAAPKALTLLRDFYYPERVQSGMMYLPTAVRATVCAAFHDGPQALMEMNRGDGEFLDKMFRAKANRWQDILPEQVVSYKVHVRQRKGQTVPPGAHVVCFHGQPRPWATPLWSRA